MTEAALAQARETARRLREIRASPLLRPYWQREETNFGVFAQPFASMPAPRQCLCDCDCGCREPPAHRDSATQTWVEIGTQTAMQLPAWEDVSPRVQRRPPATNAPDDDDDDDDDDNADGLEEASGDDAVADLGLEGAADPVERPEVIIMQGEANEAGSALETSTLSIRHANQSITNLRVSPTGSLDIIVRAHEGTIPPVNMPTSPSSTRGQTSDKRASPRRSSTPRRQRKIATPRRRNRSTDPDLDMTSISLLDFASISEEDLLRLEVEVLRRHERLRRILER